MIHFRLDQHVQVASGNRMAEATINVMHTGDVAMLASIGKEHLGFDCILFLLMCADNPAMVSRPQAVAPAVPVRQVHIGEN